VVTLGVTDFVRARALLSGFWAFKRRFKATGDEIAFFDGGGHGDRAVPLGRGWPRMRSLPAEPRPQAFSRQSRLAQMCRTDKEVDALMTKALVGRSDTAEACAEDIVRRLFGLFRRSGWSSVGRPWRAPGL